MNGLMKGAVPAYIGYDATAKIPSNVGHADEYHGACAGCPKCGGNRSTPDGRGTTKWAIRLPVGWNAPARQRAPSIANISACSRCSEKYCRMATPDSDAIMLKQR